MKTLVINAHPKYNAIDTYSQTVYQHYLEKYQEISKLSDLEKIDLYNMNIPKLDKDMLNVFTKTAQNERLNDLERDIQMNMHTLLTQFKNSKRIVIIMPVFNFNIPSKLKDYIDNILIPRETFRYTETGSVPLLNDGRKVLLIQTSGAIYTNNDRYTAIEYGYQYLKTVFCEFMGFDSFTIVRVQGIDIKDADRESILKQAFTDLDKRIVQFLDSETF